MALGPAAYLERSREISASEPTPLTILPRGPKRSDKYFSRGFKMGPFRDYLFQTGRTADEVKGLLSYGAFMESINLALDAADELSRFHSGIPTEIRHSTDSDQKYWVRSGTLGWLLFATREHGVGFVYRSHPDAEKKALIFQRQYVQALAGRLTKPLDIQRGQELVTDMNHIVGAWVNVSEKEFAGPIHNEWANYRVARLRRTEGLRAR